MTVKLTPAQIAEVLNSGAYPSPEWEGAIEDCTGMCEQGERDVITATRFLEQWYPGETWHAREFRKLMYAHYAGRWPSAAEIGTIRASEDHEDGKITDHRWNLVRASDDAASEYLRQTPGCKIFEDTDGSVLTFNDLYYRADLANASN